MQVLHLSQTAASQGWAESLAGEGPNSRSPLTTTPPGSRRAAPAGQFLVAVVVVVVVCSPSRELPLRRAVRSIVSCCPTAPYIPTTAQ